MKHLVRIRISNIENNLCVRRLTQSVFSHLFFTIFFVGHLHNSLTMATAHNLQRQNPYYIEFVYDVYIFFEHLSGSVLVVCLCMCACVFKHFFIFAKTFGVQCTQKTSAIDDSWKKQQQQQNRVGRVSHRQTLTEYRAYITTKARYTKRTAQIV